MIESHPISLKVPPMSALEYTELRHDIAKNGLLDPITLYQDKILDGRHRHQGCLDTGIEPVFEEYTGDDPLGFVLSKNLHRRSLTAAQRRDLAKEYIKEHAEQSDRAIAKVTGIHHETVAAVRSEMGEEVRTPRDANGGNRHYEAPAGEPAATTNITAEVLAGEAPIPLPAAPRIERGLKKDGTPRQARGRKPGTTAAPKAPAEPESPHAASTISESESDQWVASTRKFLSTNTEDTMFALTTFIREHSDQIQTRINEQKRTFFVRQFATSMGLKIADA